MTTPASPSAAADAQPSPNEQQQPEGGWEADTDTDTAEQDEQTGQGADAADDDADDDEQDADAQDDDDQGDKGGSKASRQAARYRVQLREARDQNVALSAALGMAQQQIVDMLVTAAGFDVKFSKLMETSVELDDLLDDGGHVDPAKVRDSIVTTARAFGLRPNVRPKPVSGQGQPGGTGGGVRLGDMLKEAAGRGRK